MPSHHTAIGANSLKHKERRDDIITYDEWYILVNEAPHTWVGKIYFGLKILMKPSHDCSY